jgi:MFS transporter, DHA1 family, quinolone resistance protein
MNSTTSLEIANRLKIIERNYQIVIALSWFATALPGAIVILFAQSRGLTLSDIGLYMAVYGATVAVLDIPTGNVADCVGRKRVTLLAYAISALSTGLLWTADSLLVFLICAALKGLARALGSGSLEAWFVNEQRLIDPNIDLQPAYARANTIALLSLSLSSLAGGLLPSLLTNTTSVNTVSQSPLAWVLLISAALHLLTLCVAWLVIRETNHAPMRFDKAVSVGIVSTPHAFVEAIALIRNNRMLVYLLSLNAITGIILAATETFTQPFFVAHFKGAVTTELFGLILTGCFLAGAIGNAFAQPIAKEFQNRIWSLGFLIQGFQALCFVGLAWQSELWVAVGLLWFMYAVRATFSSSFLGIYNQNIPDERRSLMLSVLSVAAFCGFSFGNALLGYVSSITSISWAWILVAIGLLVNMLVFRRLFESKTQ